MQTLLKVFKYGWALPNTIIGLLIGVAAFMLGARFQMIEGVLEFHGGLLARMLAKIPLLNRFVAITLGHIILGKNAEVLNAFRAHEQVHVRQYERWVILFIPAYILLSICAMLRGKKPYLENRFEREAYAKAKKGAENSTPFS